MKSNIYIKQLFVVFFVWISTSIYGQNFTAIQLNTTPNIDSCSSDNSTFGASIQREVLSGDNIPLNITLPGTLDPNCDVTIQIDYASPNNKLQFDSSPNVTFAQNGNILTTSTPLEGNNGMNFNVFFKFPNFTTCNGEIGTFNITFTTCNSSCTVQVQVVARAANYWTYYLSYVGGNAVCGTSKWQFHFTDHNPNPSGYGAYKISGTISEAVGLPVVGNSILPVARDYGSNSFYYFTLNNCQNQGTIITNTVHYSFLFGDDCETEEGDKTADSHTLVSPSGTLSFTEVIESSSGHYDSVNQIYELSAGCEAVYKFEVKNNSNITWNINSIIDNFPAEIDIDWIWGYQMYPGFQFPNTALYPLSGPGTFSVLTSGNGFSLAPGNRFLLFVKFTVKPTIANGTIVNNMATLNFQGGGVNNNGGTGSTCQGVNCPNIDTSSQNDTAQASFKVVTPIAIETIKKCTRNAPPSNIYSVQDTIHFSYFIGNSGSGSLNTTLSDLMNLPGQNLQIIPSSISSTFYTDIHNPPAGISCSTTLSNPQSTVANGIDIIPNFSDLQHPIITVNNMPGNCGYNLTNVVKINFDAIILSQNYGNKTNTVTSNHNNQSSVNYTIDQVGILQINKRADQEFVENGGGFNYIIELTNSGSVAVDHIQISDNLPSCVNLQQGIIIKDMSNNNINFTSNGSLNIVLDPLTQLSPLETFTITIPVIKNGGGNCCNESVSAQGTMLTNGVVLEANNGSVDEPAACVKSKECCEIPDFERHLYDNEDGTFNVSIIGGSVPIQQVDVSVIDYHVKYNQRDCKPQDMGTFGNMSTQNVILDGLVLDNNTNNTANLTWNIGSPSVLNTAFDFSISKPNVLNLECCKVDFYFCLKVTIKDVNCNVCEKIICIEPKEECNLTIENVNDVYCNEDTIDINWSGSNTSGQVNIFLVPQSGGSSIQIASNQLETGSISWSVPQNITPCDKRCNIVVVDSDNQECRSISNTLLIKCCHTCDCGQWGTNTVQVVHKFIEDLDIISSDKKQDKNNKFLIKPYEEKYEIKCQGKLKLHKDLVYHISSPLFNCNSEECQASYTWKITNITTGYTTNGQGRNFNFTFNQVGVYKLMFFPMCGGNKCDVCEVYFKIY